ncbi:MAG: hypothetical protein FJ280_26830 [Planctomycetes bacterium]|nr:hypothetical protein [Planctomycetota bacterium]
MLHVSRPTAQFVKLAMACLVVVVSGVRGDLGQRRGPGDPVVKVGAYAPDFNLPRLTVTSDPNGKPIGIVRDTDTVQLSSFRGKRPVCLIMSSYT